MAVVVLIGLAAVGCGGCGRPAAQSMSGVKVASVGHLNTNGEGHTSEQQNIIERIKRDNEVGSTRHLYVIAPSTGQVILYSTVKGKPTSSGKRLNPRNIDGTSDSSYLPVIQVGSQSYTVKELPNEDGTYGGSAEYLFWFTPDGAYHQHYLNGSDIVHVSDRPLVVKDIIIRVESK